MATSSAELTISLDGKQVAQSQVEFSGRNELSVTFTGGGIVLSGASRICCQLEGHFSVNTPTPDHTSDQDDEWLPLPGTRQDRCTLALDVPGYTVCFDASVAVSSSQNSVLRAVRVVRQQRSIAADASGEQQQLLATRERDDNDEQDSSCIDGLLHHHDHRPGHSNTVHRTDALHTASS